MRHHTRKGPPPQRDEELQGRMRELIKKTAENRVRQEELKQIRPPKTTPVIDVTALGEADADSKPI